MTYSVVYASATGNTALLAQKVRDTLPAGQCVYFGEPDPAAAQAEVVCVGFWTDKGSCNATLAAFLESLVGRQVFLFGTAGFGGEQCYFDQILERVATHLRAGNKVMGCYMCQGKMPQSVRTRYAAMEAEHPEQARSMLDNFDRALSHPDAADLAGMERAVTQLIRGAK